MSRVVIQIPVPNKLRLSAEKAAFDLGFSSLQDSIRLFLTKLAQRKLVVTFQDKEVRLSARAERRYNKIIDDIKKGKGVYRVRDVEDLFDQLSTP